MNREREIPVRIIVRRKKQGHAHHGGAWKVAFADFMTAMFALFLVLWLVNQSTDIKSAVAGYFQDPLGRANEFGSSILPGQGAQASMVRDVSTPNDIVQLRRDRLVAAAHHIQERVNQAPELAEVKKYLEVQVTSEGLYIQLLEDSTGVFFESGRSAPSVRGREILKLLGSELGALPFPVRVDGYTDARPYAGSSNYSNWELSADRANAARRIMAENGLAIDQVQQIRGHADRDLRTPGDPNAASNRRVTIMMLLTGPGDSRADSTHVAAPADSAHAAATVGGAL